LKFRVFGVDLADRRGIDHVDKPDFHDVVLFLKHWCAICRILALKRPNLVYLAISQTSVGFMRDSIFMLAAILGRRRVVIHLHGANLRAWYTKQPKVLKQYARALIGKAAGAIVLGESLRHNFAPFIDSDKIFVVPNGIEIPDAAKNLSDHDQATRNHPPRYRILHLSTLLRQKGALAFIEAIPKVVAKRQDVEFILAGPWANKQDQQWALDFIKRADVGQFVTFTGQVHGEAKFTILRSCDLFAFPGIQQEGQPLVVIEAMAVGLPVLFTNRGCLRETVVEGETGMEIAIDDPQDLADKILWMLDHPVEMKKMGAAGRARYESCFTLERYSQKMLSVLSAIAEENYSAVLAHTTR
jgi:glycosyltransferase involved in cell wall biosynthesis